MTPHKRPILAQGARGTAGGAQTLTLGQWIAVVLFGLGGVAAIASTAPELVPMPSVIVLDLPRPTVVPVEEGPSGEVGYWREDRVRRGDTIGRVLARLGVEDPQAIDFLRTDGRVRSLYQLKPGKPLTVETDEDGLLLTLRFVDGDGKRLSVSRQGERFAIGAEPAATEIRWRMASGEIRSSLFGAADAAGLPDSVTLQMADVFAGDIDFYQDLRRGDRFSVVYEMRYVDGEPVGPGSIVAAEFDNRGKTLRAFQWRDSDGTVNYYAEDGSPLRKAFLRSPMEFSRITSGFSGARFHPILQNWRAHKGVDYAAPAGTPVRATGNAKVVFVGRQTGYGNVIQLQHQAGMSTLYAHLSAFAAGLHAGGRVSQGEVIGYVGQTGWATGPHLHYEFRVNNEQRNPLTVALPLADPLGTADRSAFLERIGAAQSQLALARELASTLVAATRTP